MPRWEPLAVRFTRMVEPLPSGCHRWIGQLMSSGYGRLGKKFAHRIAYRFAHGIDVPAGLETDHLCRNRWCVNPAHLEAVAKVENLRRQAQAAPRKTTCGRGHPLTEDNVYRYTFRNKSMRQCRACAIRRARHRRVTGITAAIPPRRTAV